MKDAPTPPRAGVGVGPRPSGASKKPGKCDRRCPSDQAEATQRAGCASPVTMTRLAPGHDLAASRRKRHGRPEKTNPGNDEGHLGGTPGGLDERLRTMETMRRTARGRLPPDLRPDRAKAERRTCGSRSERDQRDRRRSTERPSARWSSGSSSWQQARHRQVGATRDATVPRTRGTSHRCAVAPRQSSSCLSGRESRESNTPGTSGTCLLGGEGLLSVDVPGRNAIQAIARDLGPRKVLNRKSGPSRDRRRLRSNAIVRQVCDTCSIVTPGASRARHHVTTSPSHVRRARPILGARDHPSAFANARCTSLPIQRSVGSLDAARRPARERAAERSFTLLCRRWSVAPSSPPS